LSRLCPTIAKDQTYASHIAARGTLEKGKEALLTFGVIRETLTRWQRVADHTFLLTAFLPMYILRQFRCQMPVLQNPTSKQHIPQYLRKRSSRALSKKTTLWMATNLFWPKIHKLQPASRSAIISLPGVERATQMEEYHGFLVLHMI
jgi:hypothetical protein